MSEGCGRRLLSFITFDTRIFSNYLRSSETAVGAAVVFIGPWRTAHSLTRVRHATARHAHRGWQ